MGIQRPRRRYSNSGLTMKLLLSLAVLGSLLPFSFSKTSLQSILALSEHLQSLEPAARSEFVSAAASVMSEEAHRVFPASDRGIDIPGCIDCALKEFDASCLISTCICSVFTILPEIVLQIFQMIGLCPRAGAAAPAAAGRLVL